MWISKTKTKFLSNISGEQYNDLFVFGYWWIDQKDFLLFLYSIKSNRISKNSSWLSKINYQTFFGKIFSSNIVWRHQLSYNIWLINVALKFVMIKSIYLEWKSFPMRAIQIIKSVFDHSTFCADIFVFNVVKRERTWLLNSIFRRPHRQLKLICRWDYWKRKNKRANRIGNLWWSFKFRLFSLCFERTLINWIIDHWFVEIRRKTKRR